ncbi:ATP phosphoribosyltransferase [Angustibacter aerolatus]|uniref:ATP phosphoribosyltransferase n=1 Tax=Angustibacter aerolatus TaxID=1162965 RepID=A0ABQ6JBB6_9ACTN|nr:ATP phosphoribosyltransferase [Angustibacter aerolatus]
MYVGGGTLDVGVTGRDLLLDSGADAEEVMSLGFGASTFRYAAPPGTVTDVDAIAGRRVATSYPGLVRAHLAERGVTPADVVRLDGAVETSVGLGVADLIADVVETGTTLRGAGLEVFGEPILRSEAVLVRRAGSERDPAVEVLQRRLQGVLVARQYVMVDYDVRVELVERACERRRVSSRRRSARCTTAAGARCARWCRGPARTRSWTRLYDLGARAILVTDILACRL